MVRCAKIYIVTTRDAAELGVRDWSPAVARAIRCSIICAKCAAVRVCIEVKDVLSVCFDSAYLGAASLPSPPPSSEGD